MFSFFRRQPPPEPPQPPVADPTDPWSPLYPLLHPRFRLETRQGWSDELHHFQGLDRDGAKVIITCFPPWTRFDRDGRHGCLRQLQFAMQLVHPGIVPILEVASQEDWTWWVRPWFEGENLEDRLRHGPVEVPLAQRWLGQIVEALDYAHQQGVLHRELTPSAIWLHRDGIRLSNFGGSFHSFLEVNLAGPPRELGDPSCMAPELITGGRPGPEADYYALGVLAFQMLCGQPPFPSDNLIEVICKTLQEPAPGLREFCPDAPDGLVTLVEQLLTKDPGQRLSTPQAIFSYLGDSQIRPQTHSQEMDLLLGQLQQEGERVSEQATFTLDPTQALAKLKTFQFAENGAFLRALVAAAEPLGCRRLELLSGLGTLTLKYEGVRLERSHLHNLWSYAFSPDSPGMRHLALGLAGALSQPGASFSVSTDGCGFTSSKLEAPRLGRGSSGGLKVSLKANSLNFGLDPFAHSRLEIRRDGLLLSQQLQPNRPDFQVGHQNYALYIDPLGSAERIAIVDGMSFSLPACSPSVGRVIVWGPLQLDLSYRHPVKNSLYSQLLQASELQLDLALEEFALSEVPVDLDAKHPHEVQYRHALMLWERQSETEKAARLYLKLLDQAHQLPAHTQFYPPLIWEAWDQVRQWPHRPQVFWSLFTRKTFLFHQPNDWNDVLEAGAAVAFTATLRWQLQVWLHWNLSEPEVDQLDDIFRRIAEHCLLPDDDRLLQQRLASGPLQSCPPEKLKRWHRILPVEWSRTRAEIQRWVPPL